MQKTLIASRAFARCRTHNRLMNRGAFRYTSTKPPTSIQSDTALPKEIPESRQTPANASIREILSLNNRTVIVTGGARGLGATLAGAVLEAGGDVVCLDVLPKASEPEWRTLNELAERSNLNISYHQCDITQQESTAEVLNKAAEKVAQTKKPIRGLVHCAGIQQMIEAMDYPIDGFRRILDVNVTGSFLMAQQTARIMKETGNSGSIVLIASMSGTITNRGIPCTAYNTSKAAVHQMTRSLAVEWGKYGIRVNSLSPGYIRTAMTDMLLEERPELEKIWMAGALLGRLGAPEDFKSPAIYLLTDGSGFMTGADLRVDGGHCASA